MYDRPYAHELLNAAGYHLETAVLPVIRVHNFKLYFQTLVAINVMKIVERELQLHSGHLHAQWSRLNMLMDSRALPARDAEAAAQLQARNEALCAAIRAGDFDDSKLLFEHLKATTIEQLEVANPKFLRQLAAEDAQS